MPGGAGTKALLFAPVPRYQHAFGLSFNIFMHLVFHLTSIWFYHIPDTVLSAWERERKSHRTY